MENVSRIQNRKHIYAFLKWNPSGYRGIGKHRNLKTKDRKEMAEAGKTWS